MNAEYKISTIVRNAKGTFVKARFYVTNVKETTVTLANSKDYPGAEVSAKMTENNRAKQYEKDFVLPSGIKDEEMHDVLWKEAAKIRGTVLNKKPVL